MKKYILLFAALLLTAKTYHYATQAGDFRSPQEQQEAAKTIAQPQLEEESQKLSPTNDTAPSQLLNGTLSIHAAQDHSRTPQNVPRLHWWHSLQWIAMLPIHSDTSGPSPEPATMFLFGTGMAGLVIITRKRIKK